MRQELLSILKTAVHWGRFRLTSGRESDLYIDARQVSLYSRGAYLIGNLIWEMISPWDVKAVGGLTMGADPIVSSVIVVAGQQGVDLNGLLIRKQAKQHGRTRLIEGPDLEKGQEVVVLDDVATSGSSILRSIEVLRSEGFVVNRAVVIVDREEGAKEALAKVGVDLFSLFCRSDLV